MATIPRMSRHALVAALSVAALAMASAVATTVGAVPAHAASCSAGYVGLSFDDGPSNAHTPALLNALKQNGLKATLFNEGQYAVAYPAQVQAEVAAGMWIGNHSYDHPHLTTLSQSQVDSEIGQTQTAIANAGGGTPKLFRPPYGETNSTVKAVEAKYGLTEIIWNIDSQDWNGASVAQIVQANSQLTNGQVILMHEWPANTLTAIPQIAQVLASHNLCSGMISPQTGRAVAPTGGSGGSGGGGGGGGGGSGSCTATLSAGSSGNGWYNLNVAVSGSSTWTVTVNMVAPSVVASTWNVNATWPSQYVMKATPNGNGNNWGFTVTTNGTTTRPSASCSTG
jgi:peptidoglycan/xylan/chitin deacetylase (PgdA/CDA1 family)